MDNNYFFKFICNKPTFDKINDNSLSFNDYVNFIEYNKQCINDMNDSQKNWLFNFCKMIESKDLCIMNNQNKIEVSVSQFYFNEFKNLCIVNI